jgi:hypothetical protein
MKPVMLTALLGAASMIATPFSAAGQSADPQPRPEMVTASWKGTTYSMQVPSGYCLPNSEQKTITDYNASIDSQNETLFHLERCGTFGRDYVLVKTPRSLPAMNIPRADFNRLMGQELQRGAADEGLRIAERDVSEGSGGQTSIDGNDYAFTRHDADCAYMVGTIQVTKQGTQIPVRIGSCLTIVGSYSISVHSYDNNPNGTSSDALAERSRMIANTITSS